MVALTHWVSFFFSLTRTADVMPPPRLVVVFQQLVRLDSFQACWRQVNVTPFPKGPPSNVANYPPIFITSVLSGFFVLSSIVFLYCFLYCPVLSGTVTWWLFVLDGLWNAVVCFQPASFLSERSRYLWCTFMLIPHTRKCIGEWAGG